MVRNRLKRLLGHAGSMRAPLLMLAVFAACLAMSDAAWAATPPNAPNGLCTYDPQFNPTLPNVGMISTIVWNVQSFLGAITANLFNTIVNDSGFSQAVRAALTLYIAIYGILFTFGMAQLTLFDFAIRMIKVGILVLLCSRGSWGFFANNVVYFFNGGTDDIINAVSSITMNGVAIGGAPFYVLDEAIRQVVSVKMLATLAAMAMTGPYGMFFAVLLGYSLWTFVQSLLMAVWVYLMSLIMKTLLFGLAPLFIACLLFNRTRHLFDGWLNQVVNASLQPILLFTFYAFFIQLILASVYNILSVPVCYEDMQNMTGTSETQRAWRFALYNSSTGGWAPHKGPWSWTGPVGAPNMPIFPIDIMTILIMFALVELASRFNQVVIMIAQDLAGASTSLASMNGAMGDWFRSAQGGIMKAAGGTPPGGRAPGGGAGGRAAGARPGNPAGSPTVRNRPGGSGRASVRDSASVRTGERSRPPST